MFYLLMELILDYRKTLNSLSLEGSYINALD